jgi:hypothetical protein
VAINRFLAPPEPSDPQRLENLRSVLGGLGRSPTERPQMMFAKNYAHDPILTWCVDLARERENAERLRGYVKQNRYELIDRILPTKPEVAMPSVELLRGGEQIFQESVVAAIVEIAADQRGRFLEVLSEVADDRAIIEQYAEAIGDDAVRPEPWDTPRTLAKTAFGFRYLQTMKRFVRHRIDGKGEFNWCSFGSSLACSMGYSPAVRVAKGQ